MPWSRLQWLAIGLVLLGGACNKSSKHQQNQQSTRAQASAVAPVESSVQAVASAAPSAGAATESATKDTALVWKGTYESQPVKLETPEKVTDLTWKNDDGSGLVGSGEWSFSVRDGTIVGTASGALGDQVVSGMLDDTTLRLQFLPTDPTSPTAMTCTGIGQRDDKVELVHVGELRCADPKAVVVRKVSFSIALSK